MDASTAAGSRASDRWMALMGPLFLVLLVVVLALAGDTPADDASGQKVIDALGDHGDATLWGAFLSAPLVAALLIFVGWLRLSFGREVGAPRKVLQYGAVIYAVGLLLNAVVALAEQGAAHDKRGDVAETLNRLAGTLWLPVVVGAGVLLIGGGLSMLRTASMPSWLGWIGLVVGVVSLLGPGGFLGFFVAPLWVAGTGLLLYFRPAGGAVDPPTAIV
jgi:hypothetical protein